MRALSVLGLLILLSGLVAALAVTPAALFGAGTLNPEPIPVGHTAAHAAPEWACDVPPGGVVRQTLRAEPAEWVFTAGGAVEAWTFNRQVPGPVLCANLGDRVEVTVENSLPVPVLFHTHLTPLGLHDPVAPGASRTFAFQADREGAHLYHDVAQGNSGTGRGLHGAFLVRNGTPQADHEVVIVLGEVNPELHPGTYAATINGLSHPLAPHYSFELGERVLIHLLNVGPGEEHTFHVHGHRWHDAGDARPIDNKFLSPHTSVAHAALGIPEGVVGMTHALAADTASFLLVAESAGDWMYHCHVYDHINGGMMGMFQVVAPGTGGVHHG